MGMPLAQCGATEHVVRFLSAHAALSRQRGSEIDVACEFPCKKTGWGDVCGNFSAACVERLKEAEAAVGDFYMYNFFDNCGPGKQGKLRAGVQPLGGIETTRGGGTYPCGTNEAVSLFCNNEAVREAFHMKPISFYGREWNANAFGNEDSMLYAKFSGCSFALYPELLKRYSAVIYNGDFDTCVPWSQNEEWTSFLAQQQKYEETIPWRPWPNGQLPSGYLTSYRASPHTNFSFVTVKGAGHMVPTYKPQVAYDFLQRFVKGDGFLD